MGVPAFYTKTGVATVMAEGKPVETFEGEAYVRETGRVDAAIAQPAPFEKAMENKNLEQVTRLFDP